MSSNGKDSKKNQDLQEHYRIKIGHYFDIFYRVMKGLVNVFAILFIVIAALGGGAVIGYFASLVDDIPLPTHAEMSAQVNSYGKKSTLYYSDNRSISDLRSDLLRSPVPLDQMSPLVLHAVIATEDENFFEHEGIVPKAIIRAGLQEVTNASTVTGGSTLTQQLIKQQILSAEVTHERKAVEILYATHMENAFEKEEILEAYMNISPFGRNNYGQNIAGIEEAAQGIFGVAASELTLPQASFLAGLPKSPISYSPYTQYGEVKEDLSAGLSRQREVLYSMFREGYITEEAYNEALNYDVTQDFLRQSEGESNDPARSYVYDLVEREAREIFINRMIEEDGITRDQLNQNKELEQQYIERADLEMRNGGYDIYSTIDADIHNAVEKMVRENQDSLGSDRTFNYKDEDGNTHTSDPYPVQMGASIIENETGRVIAFVGGRDYNVDQYNIAFDSRRGTGSAIKPLMVYGPALAENYITPATIIPDIQTTISIPGSEPWTPRNFGRVTNEWRDARHWLAVSQNIPNVRLYLDMRAQGIDVAKYIRAMGIGEEALKDNEFSMPSISLGQVGLGPTPTEVAAAYAMIGNKGVYNKPYVIERIVDSSGEVVYQHEPNPTRVWSEDANYLLYDMMRDVVRNGTARSVPNFLNFNIDLASKTGTTNDTMDVWYAGTTPKISLATWMGYGNNNLTLQTENGMSASLRNVRNWTNIMNTIHSVKPEVLGIGETMQPPADGSIKRETVLARTGMKAGEVKLPNNRTARISGDTKSEIFSKNNLPGVTTYDFAVGAKPEELQKFWAAFGRSQQDADQNNDSDENNNENENNDSGDNESNDTDSNDNGNGNGESENSEDNNEEADEPETPPADTPPDDEENEESESSDEEDTPPDDEE